MARGEACAVLVVLILLLMYFMYSGVPSATTGAGAERMVASFTAQPEEAVGTKSWVRLYEAPMQRDLAFEFAPDIDYTTAVIATGRDGTGSTVIPPSNGFLRQRLPVNLKSLDLNLPKTGLGNLDVVRRIEIWGVYGGDTIASTESDFYNSYLEPDWALRANPAKYRLVARVEPGQRVRGGIVEPTKSVLLIASL